MQAPQVRFVWGVCEAGYRIESDRLISNRYQTQVDARGLEVDKVVDTGYRFRTPLEEATALARDFSQLDPMSESEILAFAAEWGPLGRASINASADGFDFTPGEPLSLWRESIIGIRRIYALHDAVIRLSAGPGSALYGDIETEKAAKRLIDAHVQWSTDKRRVIWNERVDVGHEIQTYRLVLDTEGEYAELIRAWSRDGRLGSRLAAAQGFRMVLLNRLLEDHKIRAALPVPLGCVEPPPALYLPEDLIGALCLLLFMDVTGQVSLRKCAGCGEWFDATGKRKDARYNPKHGSRCSVAASRRGDTKKRTKKGGETQ